MKEKDKKRVKGLAIASVIFVAALQLGWLQIFGLNPIKFGGVQIGEADDVYFKVNVKESLGAFADEDIIVNAYTKDGGVYTYLDSATASSGLATFSGTSVKEGSHVWLQARQGPPASADGYVMPVREFIVGTGDPTDTVSAKDAITGESTLWVNNLHDSAEPHFTYFAPDNADLASGTADNLTTGDTYIKFNIYIDDDECWYGAPDFTDLVNGEEYIGGIWVVLRTSTDSYTFEKGSARYQYTWQDLTYEYYAFNWDVRLWQDSLQTGDLNTFTATMTLADGADFDGGANTWQFEVYDMYKVQQTIAVGNFVDGGALAPAAVTAYCD
jgi:hypothetical protein